MDIVFGVDGSALPGLHVAAYSLLQSMTPSPHSPRFTVFSNALNDNDVALLRSTLSHSGRMFSLDVQRVPNSPFASFPSLNNSLATYYRLFAAQAMTVRRFLYVDADTLCDVDVTELQSLDMGSFPAGWVPEARLPRAVDRRLAEKLGNREGDWYFNAGVILINVAEWKRQRITERAIDYVRTERPTFHDQSALNYILHGNALVLDSKFNCMSNMRRNWPALKQPYGGIGRLVHFLDYPKPWDLFGEWLHPQYALWRDVLDRTALNGFRSWHTALLRKLPRTHAAWAGYKKAARDRFLFAAYARGWSQRIKGISPQVIF